MRVPQALAPSHLACLSHLACPIIAVLAQHQFDQNTCLPNRRPPVWSLVTGGMRRVSVSQLISLLILASPSQSGLWPVWTSFLWSSRVKWRPVSAAPHYWLTHHGVSICFAVGGWVVGLSLVGVSSASSSPPPASLQTAPRLRPGSAFAQSALERSFVRKATNYLFVIQLVPSSDTKSRI